ncbi:hypothetical protein [Yinghuangia soli]|uniref:DUF3426 domain-containing protein n=1 Tax=Yinghuangia soli TaxID=2908204 RepID=A0AA41Q8P2_9ACTN|nr:hypothetical protein [Yinghuangia soli]MCF2532791.1 hypothetical protein [Yinghuangia soli]
MGARLWRTATTCAAVLLATTSCVVGPTITDDPPKPAAATDPAFPPDQPNPPQGGNPGNWPPNPGNPTAAPPSASPSPTQQVYAIGGTEPFEFAPGMKLWVEKIDKVGPIAVGAPGREKVAVRIVVRNDSNRDLRSFGLIVTLRACPAPSGSCSTPGDGPDRVEPTTISAGSEQPVVRYFGVTEVGALATARIDVAYNTARGTFGTL